MPEYLAPGVYVEELDVGIRPIEGVSTSTAGMVGVTERGPVDVPMLVTSFAQFQRLFGGYLDFDDYGDACFLPHAVEGFFQNGGKRLFVTRVVPELASAATVTLADRGETSGFDDTRLVKHAREGETIVLAEATAGLNDGDDLRIGDGSGAEYVALAGAGAVTDPALRVAALRIPLANGYVSGSTVTPVTLAPSVNPNDLATFLDGAAAAGATVIQLLDRTHLDAGDILRLGATAAEWEYARVASVPLDPADLRVTLVDPLMSSHADGADAVIVEESAPGASQVLTQGASAGDGLLVLDAVGAVTAGALVRIDHNTVPAIQEFHVVGEFYDMRLRLPAYADHPALEPVIEVSMNPTAGPDALDTTLDAAASAGDRTLLLDAVGTLAADSHVRLGAVGPTAEFATVESVAGSTVTLRQALERDHGDGSQVERVTRAAVGPATTLVQALEAGETTVFLADDGVNFDPGTLVEIGAEDSPRVEYQTLEPAAVGALEVATALAGDHPRGALVGRRDDLLQVEALDVGEWGNELRVVADEDPLLATTVAIDIGAGLPIPLTSVQGVEEGTVLEIDGGLAKVTDVDGNEVTIAPPSGPLLAGTGVRSREFSLRVEWVKEGRVVRDETLRHLSLDHRHSRYVEDVIGLINGPPRPSDRRPEGQSDFIRVDDPATEAQSEANIRVGPDILTEIGAGGVPRAAGRFLTGGSDALAALVPATYIGTDNVDPDLRTGLQTLRNENRISIVAIPGRTEQAIQEALINHCELERYRFCVLDSLPGADRVRGAAINVVQDQRNLYDSRYAALYYPWLVVRDPFPDDPQNVGDFQLPPSGHMLGIYARTDVERGVHKAPANTVIRGILNLQRKLNKAEHDLLNPSPTNINVLRDFREEGRGLRVWGARCITSDTDWKYVNVRRLFIFLEQSLDEGTQWVVFEPNDEPLWARVRQSITAFLTRVWRDGALQGATAEEAFFVRCDRTTMTQDDIDNGRLIVLVGVAPVKPAEFVIIRIFQSTQQAESQ